MPGEGALSTEVRPPKAPEAKRLQKKRVHKREVKGFYYHAAEYQRQKQNERKNIVNKMFHGLMAPFSVHVQAWRLRHFANKYGGRMQGWVLDNDIAQKALDKNFTEKDIREFKAKTQLHTVFEKYEITKADEAMAKSVLQNIFDKKGTLSKEDIQNLQQESGLDEADIMRLATTAKENAGNGYLTVEEMKGKFADDALFGGLTEDQKKLATKICLSSWASTVLAAGKYGVVAAMGVNPLFLGGLVTSALVSGGLSTGLRVTSLLKEGQTYGVNKLRGIEQQKHTGWMSRAMGVDWDKDYKWLQIARAAAVGAGIGLIFKFHPQILDGLGDFVHHGIPDHIPHVAPLPVPVHHELGKNALEGGIGQKIFHEHLSGYEQSVRQVYLPDTQHHDWQQLHTFVQHQKLPDGHTVNELKLSYNGVDDGIAHGKHYIDLMMPNGKQVFVQNDAVLAVNGPDADKLIKVFGLVNEHGHQSFQQIGEVHSINLAHQLGLNQGRIDNFAKLTQEAHGHLWHGTQDASDLQTILHDRGLYNNGNNGNYLYGVRIGGGYYDSAHHVFRIGASNHYYDHHLLTDKLAKEYHGSQLNLPEAKPEFHSAIAGPLQWFDDVEDRVLAFFDGRVFSNSFTQHLDQLSDFGLRNTDYDASAIPRLWAERPWYIGGVLLPYVGAGYAGYLYGKNRVGKKLTLPRAGLNTALEGAMFTLLPGTAVTATLFYWIAKIRNKKKREKAPVPTNTETNPETRPANSGGPSDTGGGAIAPTAVPSTTSAQSTNPAAPTEPVESTVAGDEAGLPPAPPPPPPATEPTPENLPATAAGEEEAPLAPPAPPANEEALQATVPVGQLGMVPPAGGEEIPQAAEVTQPTVIDETLSSGEDRLQQVINAQHILSENPSDEERVRLYSQLERFPAGRVLQMLEAEKRTNPSEDPETLLTKAIVSASVVDWNPKEGELAVEEELSPEDIREISQALFDDTTDEHVRQVEDAYHRYEEGNQQRQEATPPEENTQS